MNEATKIEKYYNHEKLLTAIFKMEQMHGLSVDERVDEKMRICAKQLCQHYRRLAICILTKELPQKIDGVEQILKAENIPTMFSQYT